MSTCYHCQAEIVPGNSFCVECGNAAPPVPMPMPVNSDNDGEGASFLAKNAGRVACILVLIGFVLLPWSTSGSNTEKGFELACDFRGAFLWIIPIGALATLVLAATKTTTFQQMKMAGIAMFIAGSLNVFAMIYMYVEFVLPLHVIDTIFGPYSYYVTLQSGAYMSFAGSLVLGLAGGWYLKSVGAFYPAPPPARLSGYERPTSLRL